MARSDGKGGDGRKGVYGTERGAEETEGASEEAVILQLLIGFVGQFKPWRKVDADLLYEGAKTWRGENDLSL